MLIPSATRGPDVLESALLSRIEGIAAGFTTRGLGSVRPPNGAADGGPDAVDLALGADAGRFTRRELVQVHGCLAVDASHADGGALAADGLVSARPGDLLVVRSADCLPVLLVALRDARPVAVGALHAGWRGLVAGILREGVALLRATRADARLVAAIGPSIGPCCFEVGPDVASALGALCPGIVRAGRGDRSLADLPLAAREILEGLGVVVDDASPPCTRCDPGRFHSFRAEGASAGRMGAFVGLDP